MKELPQKEADVIFDEFDASHRNPSNRLIHFVCIPLLMFAVLGMAWSLPFPYLGFLGRYNGYVNWASFILAFAVYFYYRLSPVVSYMLLLLIFAISMIIVKFEKWEIDGGPSLWLVSATAFLFAVAGLVIGDRIEGKSPSLRFIVKAMLTGPLWMLRALAGSIGLKLR